jgi:Lrp/AsnC family transcriptional regulator for asnA, asnC and gidA
MTSPTPPSTNLDEMDFAILSLLQEDGRMSFTDIAKELDVAANTIRYRVTKLIETVSLHFFAFVNPLELNFNAISEIQISISPSRLIEQVGKKIAEIEEVSFVVMATGEADLLVEANCQDTQHLRDVLNHLHQIEGVEKTKTCTYLKVFKWHQPDLGKIRERRSNLIPVNDEDSAGSDSIIRNR